MADEAANELPRFVTGGKPGPGRPKGSKNKLCENFLADMLAAWETSGKAAIAAMIEKEPGQFVKTVAGLVPKDLNLNVNDTSEMTDDELAERVRQLAAQLSPFLPSGDGDAEAGVGDAAGAQKPPRVH